MWPWPLTFWSQKPIGTPVNPSTVNCDQSWVKFPSLVCEIHGVQKVFGTHRLTHSRTDRPEYRMHQHRSNGGESIKIVKPVTKWLATDWQAVFKIRNPTCTDWLYNCSPFSRPWRQPFIRYWRQQQCFSSPLTRMRALLPWALATSTPNFFSRNNRNCGFEEHSTGVVIEIS